MNCILCNDVIGSTALIEIHLTYTTHSKTLLVNFIKKTLNYNLNNFGHSKYLCTGCYNIFEELDFTQLSCFRLKKQILDRCIFKNYDSFFIDASSQTGCDQNERVFEKKEESLEGLQTAEQGSDDDVNNDDDYVQNDSDSLESFQNLEVKIKTPKTKSIKIKVQNKKPSKSQECNECNKRFVSKNGLAIHIKRKHHKKKNDEPKVIEKRTRKSSRNITKEKCSLEETPVDLEPETNDDNSSNNSDVPLNEVKKKTKKEKTITIKASKYPCPQCPKMWRSKSDLKTHLVSHSEIRPFICEICGKAYKHKYALNVHVGMHNGINPFSCPHCKKSFTQKGALQRHIPIHTGEAPYQCDLCGKRFVHHTSFNMHTLAHMGQKAYKCEICGLALLSDSHLKRHMKVHTGERPYSCTQCGKRFAERYSLTRHQRLHEAGQSEPSKRLYRCQLCGVGFDRKPKLEEHLSNNHNKISDTDQSRNWIGLFLNNSQYPTK